MQITGGHPPCIEVLSVMVLELAGLAVAAGASALLFFPACLAEPSALPVCDGST